MPSKLTGAIFRNDRITIETRSANVARRTVCVVQTLQTFAGDTIATAFFARIDVTMTLARSARIARFSWISVISRSTDLAQFASVSLETCARNVTAVFGYFAASGKAVMQTKINEF